MDTLKIAQLLKNKYELNNTDFTFNKIKHRFLSECIIPTDIMVISGRGATLQTNNGELFDFASMTVNCILGQNDPWVNANLIAYILSGRPSFLTTRLGSEYYYKVAKRIGEVTKIKDFVVNHRQCNGTDVTELAVLAAYKHRKEGSFMLASFNNSYHGQSLTSYIMSGLQQHHKFFINESPMLFLQEPSHTDNIEDNKPLTEKDEQTLLQLYEMRDKIFAVILEPIQVNNAVNTPSKAFLKRLKQICEKSDIALIYDEVQTGFGWLGTMTAAERYKVWPNLMAISKAVTSGNGPLSALVTDKIYQDIKDGSGAKTNGADIRSLIAASAVMDRLLGLSADFIPDSLPQELAKELQVGLLSKVPDKSALLYYYLKDLQSFGRGLFGKIKGDSLIRGLEVLEADGSCSQDKAYSIQYELLHNGVLVRQNKHTLIFKIPVVITEKELEKGFSMIKKVINKYK